MSTIVSIGSTRLIYNQSLREVTRLGLRNGQDQLFTENAYLKK
jgi:hypothetical protein